MIAVRQPHDPEVGLETLYELAAGIGVMVILGLPVDIAVEQPEQGMRAKSALGRNKPDESPTGS